MHVILPRDKKKKQKKQPNDWFRFIAYCDAPRCRIRAIAHAGIIIITRSISVGNIHAVCVLYPLATIRWLIIQEKKNKISCENLVFMYANWQDKDSITERICTVFIEKSRTHSY